MALTESDYAVLRRQIQEAIWGELDALEASIEDSEELPYTKIWPVLQRCQAFGLLVPAEYGGLGLSVEQYLPILAEFAKIQGGIRVIVHVHNSFAHALSEIGSEAQCAEILPGAAQGQRSVAFALTEPMNGTGADLSTRADRQGDTYRITGRKWLITNSDFASHFIVMAKTAPTKLSAFLVPRDSGGLSIEALPETMGCKGGQHGELTFRDVVVPTSSLLGREGQGGEHLERALEISRVFIAASSWGTAERALDLSRAYAAKRRTFGRPIAERQAVQRYLAEMAIDVYAMRTMLLDAARKWDRGERIPAESSMCKQFGLEAVGRVTDRALLVHGGIGYTRRHPIERLYRDARLNWLEEGTPTIQYMVIARQLAAGYTFSDDFTLAR
jgi:alkylation response protein AidB-like acyl-CoA dehydrogenase